MKRVPVFLGWLVVALLVSACAGTREADPAERRSDVESILALWAGFNEAWSAGAMSGYEYVAAHDHPALACTAPDFDPIRARLPAGLVWRVDIDAGSIERHDRWRLRDDRGTSFTPEGRIYRHRATSVYSGDFPTESFESETHSAILDGAAVFFFDCRD